MRVKLKIIVKVAIRGSIESNSMQLKRKVGEGSSSFCTTNKNVDDTRASFRETQFKI